MQRTLLSTLFVTAALGLASFTAPTQALELTTNLAVGKPIPADYYWNNFGCSGKNKSPMLQWKGVPAGTKSFAVTVHDADAPTGGSGFWHYLAFDIPASTTGFAEDALSTKKLPAGTLEGRTDLGVPGFFGPCPPVGRTHRYTYTVYALKTDKLGVPDTATAAFVGFNLWMNTLEKASFEVIGGPR